MERKKKTSAPATKEDVKRIERRVETARKDLKHLEKRMDGKMDAKFAKFAEELKHHMNVVAENLVHDFKGIFKDRLEQHEDRIVRLEEHVGLAHV